MTKTELCDLVNISRPTLDSKLQGDSRDLYLFLLSFEKWEVIKRLQDYKKANINGKTKI